MKGSPEAAIPLRTVATLSNPLRYAFDEDAKAATQFTRPGSFDEPPIAEGEEPGLEATDYYSPVRCTFANGIHAVVVETDPRTAEVRILDYAVTCDCGTMINPMIVEGQIHGGVAQGVAGALYERLAYDEDGQLQNASFMDFLMPYATEVPARIDIRHLETPSPLNPLGVKGAGEAGVIPAAAAIAAAIEDAEGYRIDHMPVSPSELFHLRIQSGGTAMKLSGTAELHAPVDRVYAALADPGVLVRTIPGCQQLETVGADNYRMTVTAGVASIKGTYLGNVQIVDQDPPHGYTLKASGQSAAGSIDASAIIRLSGNGAGTVLEYDADAVVAGAIGGVGQRMLSGAAKKLAGEFFAAVDRDLEYGPAGERPPPSRRRARSRSPAPPSPAPRPQPRRRAPSSGVRSHLRERSGGGDPLLLLAAGALGAVVALAGVALGGWLSAHLPRFAACRTRGLGTP